MGQGNFTSGITQLNDLAIYASGISRSFGDVKAVDGVDLAIPRGEVYGFLGPNGAGKTTVVRMLITLLLPTAGQAWVTGRELVSEAREIRLRIGAAPAGHGPRPEADRP